MARRICPREGAKGKDQMRRMRDGVQKDGPVSVGEAKEQGAVPKGLWARRAGSTADATGLTGEADLFFAAAEVEDGPKTGPWEIGMSTQEMQSPQALSPRSMPGSWGI